MNITPDLFKLSQKERILNLLQRRGGMGVKVYEIIAPRPDGLGVAQYNARIKELRTAGHEIVNIAPGHFVLRGTKHYKPQRIVTAHDLPSHSRKSWEEMGAWLRGEGPKPVLNQPYEQMVQEALL